MRFQNGQWLQKPGHESLCPVMVSEVEVTEDAVFLYGPTAMFDGALLTIRVTAPMPETLRVETWHYAGVNRGHDVEFDLNLPKGSWLEASEEEDTVTIQSGTLRLTVDKRNCSMRYEREGELLTCSGQGGIAYVKTDWKGYAYSSGEENAFMRQQLRISVGERFYGLGERFTPLVKNGQSVEIWNEDGGTSSEQSYKNIPFYLSSRGYGVFVNHTEQVSFEMGSEMVTKVQFSVPGERLDYFIFNGPTMKEALMRYTDLTGKPSLPPEWSFGLWLSTSFVTEYDEQTVLGFIDGMKERGIPLTVFHFDCKWMKPRHWTDFCWDSEVFPDPEGLIQKIHDKGIKVCVWINPYIAQRSVLFEEGCREGYFLKRPNGSVWQWDMWQPGLAIVDFTNPKACQWYREKLAGLLKMGVDCLKTDFGERIPVDAVYHNGADPVKMHNYYSYLYNQLVYETIEACKGQGEAILFARAATAGGQKFPVHWGGDCSANYESMGESLRGGLSLTSSGFGFWSHDIGGFEDTSTPDVYKRWAAFGLLSTHSRLHGSISYRVPWNYGEEAVEVMRFFTRLKMSLMPYIYASAVETARTGVPMMRSMALEFPEDENCGYLDRQYMFGERMLAAPIFNDQGMGNFYLPEGTWTDYLTGEALQGGRWYQKKYDYLHLPLFVRENSVIARGIADDRPDYDYADQVEFRVYELRDRVNCEIFNKNGRTARFSGVPTEQEIQITVETEKPFTVRLVNFAGKEAAATGARIQTEGKDLLLVPEETGQTEKKICIRYE